MFIIYFGVALLSTIAGSMAGLGGGVIIKPVLDFLGDYNISTIGLLSSFTVFSMAFVSIIKQIMYKSKIDIKNTGALAIGSVLGGLIGQYWLTVVLNNVSSNIVSVVQSSILALLLTFVYIYMNNKGRFKSYNVDNFLFSIILGLILGFIAAFLGIGGGPINVAFLTIFFSMEAKNAARDSVIIILFSQGSKILSVALGSGFASYDLSMLGYMVIGGILGGLIGSKFNRKFSNEVIIKVFNTVVAMIIALNIYNIITVL
ncbi:sulfite exporter TauE/SafE family protein [Clostridium sp. B9]|uniref:sulfite exporter TauE/SafE family protein n=1 Tax=Clostridium sp. B9 TaxID=3423224 RepID=UPI003D2EA6A0